MTLARIISLLFHPLLIPTYMFLLFIYTFPLAFDPIKDDGIWSFIFIVFCVTFLLPVLNIGLFKTFGTIKSLAMETRRERVLPFTFVAVLYCTVTYLFYSRTPVSFSDNFLKFLIIVDALVIVSTLITVFYKVSIHSLAVWGLIGILFPLNKVSETGVLFYPTLGIVVLAGIIMSARLKLNAHSPREVLTGALFGFATGFVAMYILF